RVAVFLAWPVLFEQILVIGALVYLAWRRSMADRPILGMLACILIGLALLDTQGYRSPYIALYSVPVGALLVGGFSHLTASLNGESPENKANFSPRESIGAKVAVAALCFTAVMAGQAIAYADTGGILRWLKTGHPPEFLYEALGPFIRPYIQKNDVIVS